MSRDSDALLAKVKAGDPQAQYEFGKSLWSAEKFEEAAKWIEMAAKQAHCDAQFALGLLYSLELNDKPKAVFWYTQAAEQGHMEAQENLGHEYGFGSGVPRDTALAKKWLTMAAEQGSKRARQDLRGIDLLS